ncbi:stevor PIR protein,putative [Plasmodium sp. gorilla clade G3]|nr:stevor PIR protein,putative [Plasmodium sp. gorilla clade G3]
MTYYNFKLIIFSILLGTLTLIYKNYWDGLYKNININNGNIVLPIINPRSLAELSHEHTTTYRNENNKSREFGHMNEKKSKKNKYPKNNTRTKQKLPVPENENNRISNSKKNAKEKYDKEKEAKSNRTSCFLKYLGKLRKKICNLFVKKNKDSLNLSDKSITENDKSPGHPNKKKSSDKISSSSKDHDKNLVNLETACVGGAYACTVPTAFVVKWGIEAGILAAESFISTELGKNIALAVTSALGINTFSQSAITNFLTLIGISATDSAPKIAIAAWGAFYPYAIAALKKIPETLRKETFFHVSYVLEYEEFYL